MGRGGGFASLSGFVEMEIIVIQRYKEGVLIARMIVFLLCIIGRMLSGGHRAPRACFGVLMIACLFLSGRPPRLSVIILA